MRTAHAATGVDLDEDALVAAYDDKQGSNEKEERALIEELGIRARDRVDDLGCGTGSFALAAAAYGAQVTAIDVAPNMLKFVERMAVARGLSDLTCEHAGFLTGAPAPASMNHVVSRFALHHLPDFWKQIALNRVFEALAPGGTFFLRDVIFSFDAHDHMAAIENWVTRMPKQSGFAQSEFETHVREEYSTYDWII